MRFPGLCSHCMLQCSTLQVQGPAFVTALTLMSLQVSTNTRRARWRYSTGRPAHCIIASSCNQTDLKWLLCELETGWIQFFFIQGLNIKSDHISFRLKLCVSSTVVWYSLNQSLTLDFQLYVQWPLNPQRANKGMKKPRTDERGHLSPDGAAHPSTFYIFVKRWRWKMSAGWAALSPRSLFVKMVFTRQKDGT